MSLSRRKEKAKNSNSLRCDIKFKMGNVTFDEWDEIKLDDLVRKIRKKYN